MPSSTDRKTNHSPNTSLTSSSVHPNGGPSSTPGSRKENRRQQSPRLQNARNALRIPPAIRRIDRAKTRVLEHRAKRAGPFLWRRKTLPTTYRSVPAFGKPSAFATAVGAISTPTTSTPVEAIARTSCPVPNPGTITGPESLLFVSHCTKAGCGMPRSQGSIAGLMSLLPGTHRRIHRLPSGTPY